MNDQVQVLTLVFADISSSTQIIQEHGDLVAHDIIQRCLERVARVVTAHAGEVRGRIGDELMCTFADVREAIRSALDIQDAVKMGDDRTQPSDLKMHIGLHHGPVLIEGEQLFGDTIHVAKRMVDLAGAGQILTTLETLQATGNMSEIQWRLADEIRIKGYDAPISIYEILRQDPSVTLVFRQSTPLHTGEQYVRCRLTHGCASYAVEQSNPVLTIGRDTGNDLAIPLGCVSRSHGRLEYQKGRIIYIDHSTNGTFIREEEAPEMVLVHREQRWLRNQGVLRLGSRNDDDQRLILHYRCDASNRS